MAERAQKGETPARRELLLLPIPVRDPVRTPQVVIRSPQMARLYFAADEENVMAALYGRLRRNEPLSPFMPFVIGGGLLLRSALEKKIGPQVFDWAREASRWFDESYLGSAISERMGRFPPFFATPPGRYQRRAFSAYGIDVQAEYHPETNLILFYPHFLPSSARGKSYEANVRNMISHEILHYASFLGGGGPDFRWKEQSGRRGGWRCSWMHEGLTELHAQQRTRKAGYSPNIVAYPHETAVAFLLQQMVIMGIAADPAIGKETMKANARHHMRGEHKEASDAVERRGMEVVRQAYLTGDFTAVRRIVNAVAKNPDAFETLLLHKDGASALAYLEARLDAAGVDYHEWYRRDPVMRLID